MSAEPRDPRRRASLVFSILLIVVAVTPWDFQGHTHWEKVGWIPFVSPPIKPFDIIVNTILFTPFGAAVAMNVQPRWAVPVAVIAGAAISLLGETMQLYSHGRFPSATDLVCNTIGAALGSLIVVREFRAVPAPSSLQPPPQTAD